MATPTLQNSGTISKFIVSVLGSASSALSLYYGSARWEPIVVMALTSIVVFLVPNAPKVP
jgi:hypothetical protein